MSSWWAGALFDALSGKLATSFFVGASIGLVLVIFICGFFSKLEKLISGDYNLRESLNEFLNSLRLNLNRELCAETFSDSSRSYQSETTYRTYTNYKRRTHCEDFATASGSGSFNSDYYATLGIRRGATKAQIKKAYRTKLKVCHPDKAAFRNLQEQKVATAITIKLREAYVMFTP